MANHLRLAYSADDAPKVKQEAFTAIPNDILDALLSADLTGRELKVAMAVVRKTIGFNKTEDDCTISQLGLAAGIDRAHASRAFHALVAAKVINANAGKYGYLVSINPVSQWQIGRENSPCQNSTNVPKQHARTCQNGTHKRQLQKTSTTTSLRSVVVVGQADEQAEPSHKPAESAKPKIEPQALVDAYHELCPTLPRVKLLTDARKTALRQRWLQASRELGLYAAGDATAGLAWWREFFSGVANSDFLTGRSGQWACNFDWLLKQGNFAKVVEGNYRDERYAKKGGKAGKSAHNGFDEIDYQAGINADGSF